MKWKSNQSNIIMNFNQKTEGTNIPQGGIILTKEDLNESWIGTGRPATLQELLKIKEMGKLYDNAGNLIESNQQSESNDTKLRTELELSQKEVRNSNREQTGNL